MKLKGFLWITGILAAATAGVIYVPKLFLPKGDVKKDDSGSGANLGVEPAKDDPKHTALVTEMFWRNVYSKSNGVGLWNYDASKPDGLNGVYKQLAKSQLAGKVTGESPKDSRYWLIDDKYVVRKGNVTTESSFDGGMRGTRFDLENSLKYMI